MRFIIFLFLADLAFLDASAQSLSEINEMRKISVETPYSEKYRKFDFHHNKAENGPSNQTPMHFYSFTRDSKNEYQLLFSGLFLFYKFFISSQDAVSCAFSPSCSEYGMLSVKKLGIAAGTLNTFDRLMRCHGLTPQKYLIDEKTGLLVDYP